MAASRLNNLFLLLVQQAETDALDLVHVAPDFIAANVH